MTGTIKRLDVASASGVITAEDGLIVGFCPSAVLAFDVPSLAIGQVVSFDLEGGRCPKALNVFVQRAPHAVNAQEKRLEIALLVGDQCQAFQRRSEVFIDGQGLVEIFFRRNKITIIGSSPSNIRFYGDRTVVELLGIHKALQRFFIHIVIPE